MKTNPLSTLILLFVFAVSLALLPPTLADSRKDKQTSVSKSKKSKNEKKAAGKSDTEDIELEKAEQILKSLSSYKKGKLTKLLNSGKKEDLLTLPGIGEKTATNIIKARPLKSSAHLISVKGIGEKTFSDIVKSMK